jgi:EmrB/QacA subfamily drug resistance transporter
MTTALNSRAETLDTATQGDAHAKRWWILAVLGIAQLMVVLDATVMNIALPQAQHALDFSNADRQWVVTGYSLAFGSLLLLGGRLGDLFGRRNTFMIGLIGFAAASAIGGASQNFEMLVAARVGQGVFGALLAPAALSLLTVTFTNPSERAKAFGVFGAIAGMGAAVGLLLGGALTEWASWRWALYVNLIFAAVAMVGAVVLLARHVAHEKPALDLPGTLAATAGLFSIVFGFSRANTDGWGSAGAVGFLVAGVVLMAVFVVLQARVAHPLLPLRVVFDRIRAGSYLAIFTLGIGTFAIFLFLIYYLQTILGYSPVHTGLVFLPMVVTVVLSSTTTPPLLLPRIGTRPTVAIGFLLSAGGMALLTGIGLHSGYAANILPGLLVFGYGMGMVMSVAFQGSTAGVHHEDAGVASAMVNTMQQVGGSIGTALLSTIAATAASDYLVGRTPGPVVLAQAQVHSYVTTFWWVTALFLVGGVVVTAMLPNRLPLPAEGEPVIAH